MNLRERLVYGAAWLGGCLPLPVLGAVGRLLGGLACGIARERREVAEENLRRAYPDKDEAWIRATAKASFRHLGRVSLECLALVRWSPEKVAAKTKVHGVEHAEQAHAEGKGVILLGAHVGNWEWLVPNIATAFRPMTAVAKVLDWEPANAVVNAWRTKTGNVIVDHRRSGMALVRTLARKEVVGILLDQGMDWYGGVWVDFFGRPACTSHGMAQLAMRSGAPVVPAYCLPGDDGFFHLHFLPRLPTIDTGDRRQDEWDNTQQYTKVLEEIIRINPGQWLWSHRRWKHRPYCPWPREDR